MFFEVLHVILKSKLAKGKAPLPSAQRGLLTKKDLWTAIADVCAADTFSLTNRVFLCQGTPGVTAELLEAIYDPWIMSEGVPR